MAKYSKAIAAFISASIGLAVALGFAAPALSQTLNPAAVDVVSVLIVSVLTAAGVFAAPANNTKV